MSAQVDQRSGSGDDFSASEPEDVGLAVGVAYGPPGEAYDDLTTAVAADPYDAPERYSWAPSRAELRADFGAHFEANYQRLVAQLYAITLDPGEAHDVVQDAYSRAWRNWAEINRSADPTAWVRRVAVRATIRSWRRLFARLRRPRPIGDPDPRTAALLAALGALPAAERRCVVLFHMAEASVGEIAAVEQVSPGTVQARLSRARQDVLPAVSSYVDEPYDGGEYQ